MNFEYLENLIKQELSFAAFEQLMNKYQEHFGVEE